MNQWASMLVPMCISTVPLKFDGGLSPLTKPHVTPTPPFFAQPARQQEGSCLVTLHTSLRNPSVDPVLAPDLTLEALIEQCNALVDISGTNLGTKLLEWKGAERISTIALAPAAAQHVAMGQSVVIHAVALTSKTHRHLLNQETSTKRIKRFMKHFGHMLPLQPQRRPVLHLQRIADRFKSAAADLVIDWVRASSNAKRIRDCRVSAGSFARLFARNGPDTTGQMMARLESISYPVLRLARVRLDSVAMLAYRHFWRTLPWSD